MKFRRTWRLKHWFMILLCAVNIRKIFSITCDSDLEWDCDSGDQCIDVVNQCDGMTDCNDGSDEIAENCIGASCRKINFACTYGGCVPGFAHCNGVKECADGSDELPVLCNKNSWEQELQGICKNFEMQCKSGECISSDDKCDGHPTCKDGSDETLEVCSSQICPPKSFRCGYGACISGNAVCNNIEECADGSDESAVMCGRPRRRGYHPSLGANHTTSTSVTPFLIAKTCQVPEERPRNGNEELTIRNAITNSTIRYGQVVRDSTPIYFECSKGYTLEGFTENKCVNGMWEKIWPTCFRHCTDIHPKSGYSTKVTFELDGVAIISSTRFKPNTVAKFSCAEGFHKPLNGFIETSRCYNGEWTAYKQRCEMECGIPVLPFTEFSLRGHDVNITDVPWHVGIYDETGGKFDYICAGTLISPRRAVTAAHCFFRNDEIVRPDKYLQETPFWIAAGKYNRAYNHEDDKSAVKRKVVSIWMPSDFQGRQESYYHDVSILMLSDFVPLSVFIRPACVFYPEEADRLMPSGKPGHFTAWNQIKSTLENVKGSTVNYYECKQSIFEKVRYSIPGDKFCVAMYPETKACKGDSGSGFVLWRNETKAYTLYAVISFSPSQTQDCSRDNVIVVTNVLGVEEIQKAKNEDINNEIIYVH